jgi:hypothetical protein
MIPTENANSRLLRALQGSGSDTLNVPDMDLSTITTILDLK